MRGFQPSWEKLARDETDGWFWQATINCISSSQKHSPFDMFLTDNLTKLCSICGAIAMANMDVDFLGLACPPPLFWTPPHTVESFHFLGTIITQDFKCSIPSPRSLSRGCTSCGSLRNSTCKSQWWCTTVTHSGASPPPSPSVILLLSARDRADCSASSIELRRWSATTCSYILALIHIPVICMLLEQANYHNSLQCMDSGVTRWGGCLLFLREDWL